MTAIAVLLLYAVDSGRKTPLSITLSDVDGLVICAEPLITNTGAFSAMFVSALTSENTAVPMIVASAIVFVALVIPVPNLIGLH